MDLPFHGRSQVSYSDLWSLARFLALKAERGSILIGWSMGGSLALMMSYLFPERFGGLLIVGASPCFGCFWSKRNVRGFMLRLEREREEFLREFRRLAYPGDFEDNLELEGAKRMLRDYAGLDIRRILPQIRQRVLILHGERDPVVPIRSALTLHNMLKRSKLITFPGGHFPEDENLIFEVLQSL